MLFSDVFFTVWLVGASFIDSPSHNTWGPAIEQHLGRMLGNNALVSRARAGASMTDIYEQATGLLDHNPAPEFLIIGTSGEVFRDTEMVTQYQRKLIAYYQEAAPEVEIIVIKYPPWRNHWFIRTYLDRAVYSQWRDDNEDYLYDLDVTVVDAWHDWRTANLPHSGLGGRPNFHPTSESARRAAGRVQAAIDDIAGQCETRPVELR